MIKLWPIDCTLHRVKERLGVCGSEKLIHWLKLHRLVSVKGLGGSTFSVVFKGAVSSDFAVSSPCVPTQTPNIGVLT